jgi:hypothetical protein
MQRVLVGLVALASLAFVGCGTSSNGGSSNGGSSAQSSTATLAAQVKAAGRRTATEKWLHYRLHTTNASNEVTVEETSTPDESSAAGTSTSGSGAEMPFVAADGKYFYDVSKLPAASVDPGKRWLALDKSELPASARSTVADRLALLAEVSDQVTSLGGATINGVASRGYRLRVPTRDFVERTGAATVFEQTVTGAAGSGALEDTYRALGVKDAAGFFEKLFGDHLDVDVYVSDGLVRRMKIAMTPKKGALDGVPGMDGVANSLASDTQFDLLSTGAPAKVTPPDPSIVQQVASYQDFIAAVSGRAAQH